MSNYNSESEIVSVGEWIVSNIILMIPIVGIVMMFVWAFSSHGKASKRNWARAMLILVAILIIVSIIMSMFMPSAMESLRMYEDAIPAATLAN